jgi:hypothetical protein
MVPTTSKEYRNVALLTAHGFEKLLASRLSHHDNSYELDVEIPNMPQDSIDAKIISDYGCEAIQIVVHRVLTRSSENDPGPMEKYRISESIFSGIIKTFVLPKEANGEATYIDIQNEHVHATIPKREIHLRVPPMKSATLSKA